MARVAVALSCTAEQRGELAQARGQGCPIAKYYRQLTQLDTRDAATDLGLLQVSTQL
jgi:hypothetical protein